MHIYGTLLSPFTTRVAVAARLKGLKHTIGYPEGGAKTPKFLKINPMGKLPVLVDGTVKLFESSVIIEYLDAKSKKNKLVPANAKTAAKARLIGAIFSEYVQGPLMKLFRQADPAKRDQAAVDGHLAEINRALDAVEGLLGKPFAVGKVSIAECYTLPTLFFLEAVVPMFGIDNPLGKRPKLNAYRARLGKNKLTAGILAEVGQARAAYLASQRVS